MKQMTLLIWLVLNVSLSYSQEQELPKNLVYANENLAFEEIVAVGNYKLLRITPDRQQNKRFIYLLDEQNLVVDTMKVMGNDRFLIRSDSNFTIRALNEYVNFKISENGLIATSGFETRYKFTSQVINPIFMLNKQLFGSYYLGNDCSVYNFMAFDVVKTMLYPKNNFQDYNLYQIDSLMVFDENTSFLKNNTPVDKQDLIKPVLTKSDVCLGRIQSPYYGWNSYSLNGNSFYMYEKRAATIYHFDIENEFEVLNKFELPIDDKPTEGWKYLFDYNRKEHYAAKRIELPNTGENKKKKRNTSPSYEYQLYSVDMVNNKMKALFKLGFDPKMIDKGLIYEIVSESKKGSAVYFHPIDPNYEYKKSTLVNY